jgi:hypothetical protein
VINTERENSSKREEDNSKNRRRKKQKQIHSLYAMTSKKSNNAVRNKSL